MYFSKVKISLTLKRLGWVCAVFMTGCTTQYTEQMFNNTMTTLHLKNSHHITRHSDWRLPMETRLFLARPQYGLTLSANRSQLPRSRTLLHTALEQELKSYFPGTTVAWADLSFDEALVAARLQRSELLVFPLFITFDDHLNSWSELNEGKGIHPNSSYGRDHAVIEILLVETHTGSILDSASLSSKQRFFSSNPEPKALFLQAAQNYAALLSGRVSHTERPR